MELTKIISISGRPGLFKIIGQTNNGVIVESLEDGKRFPAYSTHQISALNDISIYTDEGEEPLADVFKKIREEFAAELPVTPKSSSKELRDFLLKVLPNHDQERVYTSDIKKLVKWYELLNASDFFNEQEAEDSNEDAVEDAEIIEETENSTTSEDTPEEANDSDPEDKKNS